MENWKEFIKGYSVSDHGRIRNDVTEHILTPQKRYRKSSHLSIHIIDKNYSVSRMVAIHFIPNPHNYPIVRHSDGNAEHNHYSNLAWGTQKDNTDDAFKHGTHTSLNCKGYIKQQNESGKVSKVKRTSVSGAKGIRVYNGKRKTTYRAMFFSEATGALYLGCFDSMEEAKQVYKNFHIKQYGVSPYEDDL